MLLYYQPVFKADGKQISHLEALLRWQHPEQGLLEAKDFIKNAERPGIVEQIGDWVLRTVFQQIQTWRQSDIITLPVAINISGSHF